MADTNGRGGEGRQRLEQYAKDQTISNELCEALYYAFSNNDESKLRSLPEGRTWLAKQKASYRKELWWVRQAAKQISKSINKTVLETLKSTDSKRKGNELCQ